MKKDFMICIVGLGYVGLPLAIEFDKHHSVVGYDTNCKRIDCLINNVDKTGEIPVEQLKRSEIEFVKNLHMPSTI